MTRGQLLGLAVVVACVAGGLVLVALVLMIRLQRYRRDIGPHSPFSAGQSPIWQLNVLDPKCYSPEGQVRLRWLNIILVIQMTLFVVLVSLVPRLVS
jgi:hypothetical protein